MGKIATPPANVAARNAIAILGAIMQMSDHAEAMGGATCIAGIAALNTLQKSLQKNGPRLAEIARAVLAEED